MQEPSRRSFLKLVAATPLLSATPETPSTAAPVKLVKLFGDGLGLSPKESVDVLAKIVTTSGIEEDDYSRGGVVEELEEKMAAALGKERAIYFATGTLANHVAVRVLAGDRPRVLVPDDSHIMTVRDTDPGRFREKLRAHGVLLSPPRGGSGEFLVTVNATWNRTDAETLAETFKGSI